MEEGVGERGREEWRGDGGKGEGGGEYESYASDASKQQKPTIAFLLHS